MMKHIPFTKKELVIITLFLIVIFLLFNFSLTYSRMRERDLVRQRDLANIQNALNVFKSSYGFYPPSSNGKIMSCAYNGSDFNLGLQASATLESFKFKANECEFGKDYLLSDLADANTKILNPIPADPHPDRTFHYYSDGETIAIFADMETNTVEDYDGSPRKLGINCGTGKCDYVKSNKALDNLMQRYQNEVGL